jgi:hypothetical protein
MAPAVPSVAVAAAARFIAAALSGQAWGGTGGGGSTTPAVISMAVAQEEKLGRERAWVRLNFPSSWLFARQESDSAPCSGRPTYGT